MTRISAPGNLLLGGEYAVLEEGGLGIALAVEPRVHATMRPAQRLRVVGKTGAGPDIAHDTFDTPRSGSAPDLIPAVVSQALDFMAILSHTTSERRRSLPAYRIDIDSSAFYRPDGRKRGFGSSAAVSVCLTAAVLQATGLNTETTAAHTVRLALEAHRAFQSGTGSGYDVFCSYHGGTGLFTGGTHPAWAPIDLSWLGSLAVFNNPSPVKTPGSIARYRA